MLFVSLEERETEAKYESKIAWASSNILLLISRSFCQWRFFALSILFYIVVRLLGDFKSDPAIIHIWSLVHISQTNKYNKINFKAHFLSCLYLRPENCFYLLLWTQFYTFAVVDVSVRYYGILFLSLKDVWIILNFFWCFFFFFKLLNDTVASYGPLHLMALLWAVDSSVPWLTVKILNILFKDCVGVPSLFLEVPSLLHWGLSAQVLTFLHRMHNVANTR